MNLPREIKESADWRQNQSGGMENVLMSKMEQVQYFKETLKATGSHHLVENTRNFFWGSGCFYNSDLIMFRNYPGKNTLG